MSERQLKAGTRMYFGVPADPMPEIMSDAIRQVVTQVPGIREAYLPQCYIEGEEEARQVLVVAVDVPEQMPAVMQDLMGKMGLLLPQGQFIDIIPFLTSSMPSGARVRECQIVKTKRKPWWKIW